MGCDLMHCFALGAEIAARFQNFTYSRLMRGMSLDYDSAEGRVVTTYCSGKPSWQFDQAPV